MSNYSDFFPAGGGGGASGASTVTVAGTTYGNVYLNPDSPVIRPRAGNQSTTYLAAAPHNNTGFQTQNDGDPNNTFAVCPAGVTTTVLNQTAGVNGGFFFFSVSACTAGAGGGNTMQQTLTMDGTAYQTGPVVSAENQMNLSTGYSVFYTRPISNNGHAFAPTGGAAATGDNVRSNIYYYYSYNYHVTAACYIPDNLPKVYFQNTFVFTCTPGTVSTTGAANVAVIGTELL